MSLLRQSYRPLLRSLPRALYRAPIILPRVRYFQTSESGIPAPTADKPPPDYAFAFDIDGVLMHGRNPTPTATTALSLLDHHNVPYILLTNGGGHSELTRTTELSAALSTTIHHNQLIQSHTPFAHHAKQPHYNTVLIVGGTADNCRHVAKEYGFRNVVVTADILNAYPAVSPFTVDKTPAHAHPLPEGEVKFDAIYVFNDPRDWALDIQIMIDLLLSDSGRLGTRRPVGSQAPHIPLYFSNADAIWSNEYSLPRMGQGAFREAFKGAWGSVVGAMSKEEVPRLRYKVIGKPFGATYTFAERRLFQWRRSKQGVRGVRRVYMVGDNPESDIKGANNFNSKTGVDWVSVLVESGVYRPGGETGGAKAVVKDVEAAVRWAIKEEEGRKERGEEPSEVYEKWLERDTKWAARRAELKAEAEKARAEAKNMRVEAEEAEEEVKEAIVAE